MQEYIIASADIKSSQSSTVPLRVNNIFGEVNSWYHSIINLFVHTCIRA